MMLVSGTGLLFKVNVSDPLYVWDNDTDAFSPGVNRSHFETILFYNTATDGDE